MVNEIGHIKVRKGQAVKDVDKNVYIVAKGKLVHTVGDITTRKYEQGSMIIDPSLYIKAGEFDTGTYFAQKADVIILLDNTLIYRLSFMSYQLQTNNLHQHGSSHNQ